MTKDKRTEKLVASAYEHVHPSTSVEDAVLANLTEQRDAARMTARMWAGVAAAALLGATLMFALAFRGGSGVGDGHESVHALDSGVALPAVPQPNAEVPKASRSIEVRLTAKGELGFRFDAKEEWKSCSLGALENALHAYGNRLTKARNVYERHRVLRKVRVVVAAHTKAPWQHVQWIMTACAKQGYATVAFRVVGADGKPFLLDASLPVDRGIRPPNAKRGGDLLEEVDEEEIEELPEEEIIEEEIEEEPEEEIVESEIEDHNETDSDEPFKAGAKSEAERKERVVRKGRNKLQVQIHIVPGKDGYRYRFANNKPGGTIKSVRGWIEESIAAGAGRHGWTVTGEIKAGHRVEFGAVAAVLAEFRRQGIKRVTFFGTMVPTPEQMDAPTLPHPRRNWG